MNLAHPSADHKTESLVDMAAQLQSFVQHAANDGFALYDVEKDILATVLKMGRLATETFLQLQGDGDLGPTVQTEQGQTLFRSEQPAVRPLRTIFGEHQFTAYVYTPGPKQKIALRPIDARLQLSESKCSYLWEEFSQYFCVESAFGQSADGLETVLGSKLSVDTLERTNQRLGKQAEEFLDALPAVPPEEEGELLVATADCKGVPMIRDRAAIPVHGPKPPRPHNRRMATLACVYSVDHYLRTPEEVLAALFREHRPTPEETAARPRPCHKRMTACFSTLAEAESDELSILGGIHAWSWAAGEINSRRRAGQVLIRLCDGQESLWNMSDICIGFNTESAAESEESEPKKPENVVDILDIIHVASYAWSAARVFYGNDDSAAEQFVRDRLLRILQGEASGVIQGMRRMSSQRNLRGEKLKQITKICNYLEKNLHHMQYNEYLTQGYPIATGVIEGACRHLVKDRMERTGMRWKEENAGAMLFVRAVKVTELWEPFQRDRQAVELPKLHPHRNLLKNYKPNTNPILAL